METRTNNDPQHGFSVATLLLLTAVVAIGAAGVRNLVVTPDITVVALQRGPQGFAPNQAVAIESRAEALLRGIAGGMIGLLVGIGIGATRPRPVAGVLLGILIGGMIVGPLAGAVLADPRNLPLAAVGSAVLVLLGTVVRVLSHHA